MVHRTCSACPTSLPCPPVSSSNYSPWDARPSASARAVAVSPRCCAVRPDCVSVVRRLSRAVVGGSNCWSVRLAGAVTPGSTWPDTWLAIPQTVFASRVPPVPCNHLYSRSCTPLLTCGGTMYFMNLLWCSSSSVAGIPILCLRLSP